MSIQHSATKVNRIACFFCPYHAGSDDVTSIISHIIGHLNYTPIKCKICSHLFSSIHDFTLHGEKHANKMDLNFFYLSKVVFDEWIHKITHFLGNEKHLRLKHYNDCLVCRKYKNYFASYEYLSLTYTLEECKPDMMNDFKVKQNVLHPQKQRKFTTLDQKQIILLYHVHHHLQYFPYRCTVQKGGEGICGFRAPFVGLEFRKHLKEKHAVEFDPITFNVDCFEKAFFIEQLDKLVMPLCVEIRKDDRRR